MRPAGKLGWNSIPTRSLALKIDKFSVSHLAASRNRSGFAAIGLRAAIILRYSRAKGGKVPPKADATPAELLNAIESVLMQ